LSHTLPAQRNVWISSKVMGGGSGGTGAGGSGASSGVGGNGGCTYDGCGPSGVCPQGQYCDNGDPCGDLASCIDIPAPCAAAPTCECILDQSGEGGQGGGNPITCNGDATMGFNVTEEAGDSSCCP
jgi:hypothetical protein